MTKSKANKYEVSCDPYENGARLSWTVEARTKRLAIQRARARAETEGVMRAGWMRVMAHRVDA